MEKYSVVNPIFYPGMVLAYYSNNTLVLTQGNKQGTLPARPFMARSSNSSLLENTIDKIDYNNGQFIIHTTANGQPQVLASPNVNCSSIK